MKKLFLFFGLIAFLTACKPTIDSTLEKLEKAYVSGDNAKAETLWQTLWERQNEMSMAQVERYILLTEKYDPEWHYDLVDDGQPDNQIDFYFAHYRNSGSQTSSNGRTTSTTAQPIQQTSVSYYECCWCGVIVRSNKDPKPVDGVCKSRKPGYPNNANHAWQRICYVGTHIARCRKCGLELQTDDLNDTHRRMNGGCCYDGTSHQWERRY